MSKATVIPDYNKYITLVRGGKGLAIDENMPFETYQEALKVYGSIAADGLWAVGDLLVFGERKYGEQFAQAIESTKYTQKTISNATWVCSQFPPSRRHKELTFSHHHAVAGIEDTNVREEILQKAEAEEWPVSKVTEEKKKRFPKKPKKKGKASESHEDAPGSTETPEESQDSAPVEITLETASEALGTLLQFLNQQGKDLPAKARASLLDNMNLLRKAGRRSGFWGGN